MNEDKKLKSTIKKFGMQSLQDIDEVNMFKDDNTVVHLKRPQSKYINDITKFVTYFNTFFEFLQLNSQLEKIYW